MPSDPSPGRGARALPAAPPTVRTDRIDALIALLGAAALCALYLATFQTRQYGDAPLLMQHFADSLESTRYWGHVLYFPAAWVLLPLVPTPLDALVLLSSLAGALACSFAYLLARLWGAGRAAAATGALLFAFSPGAWFFSTTIEVHTLHAACVGLCALVAELAPWRRAVSAALLVAAALPLLFFSHQSGVLLGPGFVLLAQAARVRSGSPRFSQAALWLALAPLFLAALLAALAIAALLLEQPSLLGLLSSSNQVVHDFGGRERLGVALEGWVLPLGLITPAFLAALVLRRLRGWRLAAVSGLVLVPLVFFVGWGMAERGGYALPSALLLAAAGAGAWTPPTRARAALALGALLIQAALGWTLLRDYDEPQWREQARLRRLAASEALPGGGVLISINIHSQYIEFHLRNARELSLYEPFKLAVAGGETPQQFIARAGPLLDPVLASGVDLALDLDGFRFAVEIQPRLAPLVDGLEAWLRERYDFEPTASAEHIVHLRRRTTGG